MFKTLKIEILKNYVFEINKDFEFDFFLNPSFPFSNKEQKEKVRKGKKKTQGKQKFKSVLFLFLF